MSTWCTISFLQFFKKNIKTINFWIKIHGLHLLLPFLYGLWYGPLIDGVCVRDLKLVRCHNKEAKGQK
jgi:hypothetical protein